MSILTKLKNFGKGLINKVKELTFSQSNKKVKALIKEKRKLKSADFIPGNIIFMSYDAKDKEQTYDKTPLMMVLKRNSKHTLGLNYHWAPMSMRLNLVKLIILANEKNIKAGKQLEFKYEQLKPLLKQLGYAPIIRKYINNRISSVGVVIPPERLLEVARLKTESFTNGKYSANELYAKARKR